MALESIITDLEDAAVAATKNLSAAKMAGNIIENLDPNLVEQINGYLAGSGFSISYTAPPAETATV